MTDALQFISIKPAEKGTAKVTIAPVDEDGTALTFAQLSNPKWQLMRTDGTVVNSRTFATNALTSLVFRLSGDDLAVFSDDDWIRRLSIQATYNSDIGTNNPLNAECEFHIQGILGQTDET